MNRGPLDSVLRHLRQLVAPSEEREATDQQLLQSFLTSHDETILEYVGE